MIRRSFSAEAAGWAQCASPIVTVKVTVHFLCLLQYANKKAEEMNNHKVIILLRALANLKRVYHCIHLDAD
jgi:hypothetical protein